MDKLKDARQRWDDLTYEVANVLTRIIDHIPRSRLQEWAEVEGFTVGDIKDLIKQRAEAQGAFMKVAQEAAGDPGEARHHLVDFTLNIVHMTPSDQEILRQVMYDVEGDSSTGTLLFDSTRLGWAFYVKDVSAGSLKEIQEEYGFSDSLIEALRWAIKRGADHLILDIEAPIHHWLPRHDAEWA